MTFCVNAFHVNTENLPSEHHQGLPSPCVILKAIRAGVGWVWLVRLGTRLGGEIPLVEQT